MAFFKAFFRNVLNEKGDLAMRKMMVFVVLAMVATFFALPAWAQVPVVTNAVVDGKTGITVDVTHGNDQVGGEAGGGAGGIYAATDRWSAFGRVGANGDAGGESGTRDGGFFSKSDYLVESGGRVIGNRTSNLEVAGEGDQGNWTRTGNARLAALAKNFTGSNYVGEDKGTPGNIAGLGLAKGGGESFVKTMEDSGVNKAEFATTGFSKATLGMTHEAAPANNPPNPCPDPVAYGLARIAGLSSIAGGSNGTQLNSGAFSEGGGGYNSFGPQDAWGRVTSSGQDVTSTTGNRAKAIGTASSASLTGAN